MSQKKKEDLKEELLEPVPAELAKQKKVFLTIHSGPGENDIAPVQIGVNGYVYRIRRDEEVAVPVSVVNVLQIAMQAKPHRENIGGQMRTTFKTVNRFSYSVRGAADGERAGG